MRRREVFLEEWLRVIYSFGGFELDTELFELRCEGKACSIEPQVFNVLAYLVEHRERVVTKDELLETLWPDRFVTEATLSHRLMSARKAVGDDGQAQRLIKTVRGRGFRFVGSVEEQPVVQPAATTLAGRAAELEQLADSLSQALTGSRQVVFVTGETGIGKTTLVQFFIESLQGVRSAVGGCLEHRGPAEPYLPVLEALGRLCRAGEAARNQLQRLAPTWAAQMPWLAVQEPVGANRERMLREFQEAIEELTRDEPLVLVLEDLHWADESTLDLVSALARRREPARLLVLGTARPAGRELVLELCVRCGARELPLGQLSPEAARELVGPKAEELHQRSGGNPLFLLCLAEWSGAGVPESLHHLVEQSARTLEPLELHLLEAGSLVGREFTAQTVASALGENEETVEEAALKLARREQFLELAGAGVFRFRHDLYREVLESRLTAARKARLHRALGECLEGQASPAALARHFREGRDPERAFRYLREAGLQAVRRHAHREAVALFQEALELRDCPELRLLLAPSLIATRGWDDPLAEAAYLKAREAATTTRELSSVLYGLATLYEIRGDYPDAQRLLEQRVRLAEDATAQVESQELLACSTYHQGSFEEALEHAEAGLCVYEPGAHLALTAAYGENPAVSCHNFAALSLWFLGYPDRALARARAAQSLARDELHAFSLAHAHEQMATLRQHRGEPEEVEQEARRAVELALRQGFAHRLAAGRVLLGWATGDLGELSAGLDGYRASGARMELPYYLGLLADLHRREGRNEAALEVLAEALSLAGNGRGFYYEPELHRMRGSLLGDQADLVKALELARARQARTLELRAALDLALITGDYEPARGCYAWFTEGFDTPDLVKAARALGITVRSGNRSQDGYPAAGTVLAPSPSSSSPPERVPRCREGTRSQPE